MKIQKELKRIQQELKAPKSQFNSFGKYKYRSLEDIVEAYKKVAGETTLVISDEVENIGDRYYVKAVAVLSLTSDGEKEFINVSAYARESENKKGMDDAQITGACSSYARKYALNGLFAIDDTKDADSKDNTAETGNKLEELILQARSIQKVDELKEFYNKNKGCGKAFDKAVIDRKKELTDEARIELEELHKNVNLDGEDSETFDEHHQSLKNS